MLEGGRELVLHDHGMPWYRLLLQRDIFFLGLQYFGFSYTWYFYVTWLPTWLQQARGLEPGTAAGYAMIPLALGGLRLDRFGLSAAVGAAQMGGDLRLSPPPPS